MSPPIRKVGQTGWEKRKFCRREDACPGVFSGSSQNMRRTVTKVESYQW